MYVKSLHSIFLIDCTIPLIIIIIIVSKIITTIDFTWDGKHY